MKTLVHFCCIALSVIILNSCNEAEPIIYNGPLFISFTQGTSGKYLVDDNNSPYDIEVGIPIVQSTDVTANLEIIHSTGVSGVQFYVPSSVTIPAGELTAQFSVLGSFDDLVGRKDTLIIGLSGEVQSTFDSAYTIYMEQLKCNWDIDILAGTWTAFETSIYEGPYAPYELTTVANPNGGDTIMVTDYWTGEFKIVFDASDTMNIRCHVPPQYQFTDATYGDVTIESLEDASFSKCYKIISSLNLRVSVEAGIIDESFLTMELQ
jgi:hypothetical protein